MFMDKGNLCIWNFVAYSDIEITRNSPRLLHEMTTYLFLFIH
jgi:hypothetical protein